MELLFRGRSGGGERWQHRVHCVLGVYPGFPGTSLRKGLQRTDHQSHRSASIHPLDVVHQWQPELPSWAQKADPEAPLSTPSLPVYTLVAPVYTLVLALSHNLVLTLALSRSTAQPAWRLGHLPISLGPHPEQPLARPQLHQPCIPAAGPKSWHGSVSSHLVSE